MILFKRITRVIGDERRVLNDVTGRVRSVVHY